MQLEPQTDIALYVITQGRAEELSRLFASIHTSSVKPARVIVITQDVVVLEEIGFRTYMAWMDRLGILTDIIQVEEDKFPGLAAKKNVALNIIERTGYRFALSIDDDMLLSNFSLQRLYQELTDDASIFAAGPTILGPDGTGLPVTKEIEKRSIGDVQDGTWSWGGFIQGIQYNSTKRNPVPVDHLAGCYLHRMEPGHRYDLAYDRDGYFLHESDFVYGRRNFVVPTAVVHHWPGKGENLSTSRDKNEYDIFKNIQYFAAKYDMGEVSVVDWTNFQ